MARIPEVEQLFRSLVGYRPTHVVAAPGRINIIGEHTDYNQGLVLPAAIDKCMYFAASANGLQVIRAFAVDLGQQVEFGIEDTSKDGRTWVNYCKGIVCTLRSEGFDIGGFDVVFTSHIPVGAGLSSSAALDCGLVKCIDQLFSLSLSQWDIVRIANLSDNTFMEVASGILDQFACTFGQVNQCMLLDCGLRTFEYIPITLTGHEFVLIDTGVQHDHVSSQYNNGPAECRQAVDLLRAMFPAVKSLSDCTDDILLAAKGSLPYQLWSRASFIVAENERVRVFASALQSQDITQMGELLYASHRGLATKYRVSCRELDLLVELAAKEPAVVGARMMGGGFGGCTLNLVKANSELQIDQLCNKYLAVTGIAPQVYQVAISDGLRVLDIP